MLRAGPDLDARKLAVIALIVVAAALHGAADGLTSDLFVAHCDLSFSFSGFAWESALPAHINKLSRTAAALFAGSVFSAKEGSVYQNLAVFAPNAARAGALSGINN